MKGTGIIILVIGIILVAVFAVGCGISIPKHLEVGRDIGAPLNRAQVTSDPTAMDQLLAKVQDGMEKHDYTSGHWQPINQNDDNDFSIAYESVLKLRERLTQVKNMGRGSVEYNVALEDLRGTVRELNIGQQDRVYWDFAWIWLVLIVGIILAAVGGFLIYNSDDYG